MNGALPSLAPGLPVVKLRIGLTRHGIAVDLFEMKPQRRSPAIEAMGSPSSSVPILYGRTGWKTPWGWLKQEMRLLDSLILRCADATRVPAGGALAVDREGFHVL